MKPNIAFYIGGMGSKDANFHKNAFSRLGWERAAQAIQSLFLDSKRSEAIAVTVPARPEAVSRQRHAAPPSHRPIAGPARSRVC